MLDDKQRELISFPFHRLPLKARELNLAAEYDIDPELDVIWKPSDGKILGVLEQNQYMISHLEAVDRVETALQKMNIQAEVTDFKLLNNGARLFVHYRPEGFVKNIADNRDPDDNIYPELILRNGYDEKTVFGIEWGLWRQVCTNGARVHIQGERMTKRISMGDTDIDVLMSRVQTFGEKTIHQVWARIQAMILNADPELPISTRAWFAEVATHKLLETFDVELAQKKTEKASQDLNEWQIYNIVTAVITHAIGSYQRRRHMDMITARRFKIAGNLR